MIVIFVSFIVIIVLLLCKIYWMGKNRRKQAQRRPRWIDHPPTPDTPIFLLGSIRKAQEYYREHGWVCIRIMSTQKANQFAHRLKETYNPELVNVNNVGITADIAHSKVCWDLRMMAYPVFQQFWDISDLVTSFDGGSYLMPSSAEGKENTGTEGKRKCWSRILPASERRVATEKVTDWFHCDAPLSNDTINPQGLISLTDVSSEDDGGLMVLDGGQRRYDKYMLEHALERKFNMVDIQDSAYQGLSIIKPRVPAGGLLIWDSKLPHANARGRKNIRLATYCTMYPAEWMAKKDRTVRRELYSKGYATGHHPFGPGLVATAQCSDELYYSYADEPTEREIIRRLVG